MAQANVKAVPDGMHTVTPHLVIAGAADAIEFYKKAFGATELHRMPGPNGKIMHACIKIGDSQIFLFDEMPEHGALGPDAMTGSPVVLHLQIPDVDSFAKRAIDAGAKVTMPVTEMFWGDRYGQLQDPFGHSWSIATHVRDVSPEEMQKVMADMECGPEATAEKAKSVA